MKTPKKKTAENFIKDIRRKTRRIFSSEQKIQIVMEALRAEMSVAELCRKYSINESQFYKWNKEFLEAGKKRLAGDTTREATSDEVVELKKENQRLKVMIAPRSRANPFAWFYPRSRANPFAWFYPARIPSRGSTI